MRELKRDTGPLSMVYPPLGKRIRKKLHGVAIAWRRHAVALNYRVIVRGRRIIA